MSNKQKFLITISPIIFALIALVCFIISMFNSSNTIPLSLGLIFAGITFISSFITKRIVKQTPNATHLFFGIVLFVLGVIALILGII